MANVATPKWLQDIAEKHGYDVEVCDYSTKEYGSEHSVVRKTKRTSIVTISTLRMKKSLRTFFMGCVKSNQM